MTISSYRHLLIRDVRCLISPKERMLALLRGQSSPYACTCFPPGLLDNIYEMLPHQIALRASNGQVLVLHFSSYSNNRCLTGSNEPPRYIDQQTLKRRRPPPKIHL